MTTALDRPLWGRKKTEGHNHDIKDEADTGDHAKPTRPESEQDPGENSTDKSCCTRAIGRCTEAIWSIQLLQDHVPKSERGRVLEAVKSFVAICMHLVALSLQIKLLSEYYATGQLWEFWLSLGFAISTAVVAGVFSLMWSIIDFHERKNGSTGGTGEQQAMSAGDSTVAAENGSDENENYTPTVPKISLIVCRTIATFVQLGRVFRLSEHIYYVCRACWSKRFNYDRIRKAQYELRDAAFIGLLEGYIGAALVFQLQLYLMFTSNFTMDIRVIFEFVALFSITDSIVSCYATNRNVDSAIAGVPFLGQCVYNLARICETGPRFLLLTLSLVYCGEWVCIGVALHVVLMFVLNACYVSPENYGMCIKKCKHFYYLFISYIEIYSFVNLNEGDSFDTSTLYYVIFYIENALMTSLVLTLTYTGVVPCRMWCMMAYAAIPGFFLHMTFLYLYYRCLHPRCKRSSRQSVDHS